MQKPSLSRRLLFCRDDWIRTSDPPAFHACGQLQASLLAFKCKSPRYREGFCSVGTTGFEPATLPHFMRDALPMALIKRNSLRESEGYCCVGASPAYYAGTTGLATPIQKMGGYYNKSLHRLSPLWSFAFNSNCKQACLLLNAKALAIAKAFVLSGRLDSNQRPSRISCGMRYQWH
jgi:hypothetical protein